MCVCPLTTEINRHWVPPTNTNFSLTETTCLKLLTKRGHGHWAITRRGQKGHGPLKWNLFLIKHFRFHLILSYVTNIFLLIAVPPSKIEISGVNPGSRMTIRENEMVELRCVVHNAKPKATIVWFRKNTEYLTGKSKRFLSYWYFKTVAKDLSSIQDLD